ncbi:hypothetical protein LINGRAHAP2_LOCUS14309 [Linum grandiflorum]
MENKSMMKINTTTYMVLLLILLSIDDSGRHVCVADEYDDCMHWCWRRLIGMDPSGIYTICDEACSAKLSHSAIIGKLREISSIH